MIRDTRPWPWLQGLVSAPLVYQDQGLRAIGNQRRADEISGLGLPGSANLMPYALIVVLLAVATNGDVLSRARGGALSRAAVLHVVSRLFWHVLLELGARNFQFATPYC